MIEQRLFTFEQTETTSDDYYTPKWIFDTLGLHFDLDVASPPHSTNVPCDRYFTQADDGLGQDWHGRVWMNPPFSGTGPWVQRWLQHGNGIALLPVTNSTRWMNALWNSSAKHCYILNIAFDRPDGKTARPWTPVWLWAIGDDNIQALRKMGKIR